MTGQPGGKKRGPLFWVVLSVIGLVAILGVVFVAIGRFALSDDGSDPGYTAVRLLISNNKDLEIISEEPQKNQILVRDKRTGEYFLHRADPVTKTLTRIPAPPPGDQAK